MEVCSRLKATFTTKLQAAESLKYMVWHTTYALRAELVPEDEWMRERSFQYEFSNGDKVICEMKNVDDDRYKEGVMFTFRCMSADGKTLFAIENSHGKPHIHWRDRKEDVDWDWRTAYWKFHEMLDEHKKRFGLV